MDLTYNLPNQTKYVGTRLAIEGTMVFSHVVIAGAATQTLLTVPAGETYFLRWVETAVDINAAGIAGVIQVYVDDGAALQLYVIEYRNQTARQLRLTRSMPYGECTMLAGWRVRAVSPAAQYTLHCNVSAISVLYT